MAEVKWIKLSTDLFSNRKIRQIERMSDGDAIIVIWLKILILAGELNDGGEIYFTHEVPFTEESLAIQFDRPRELIALALRTFEAFDMIEIQDDQMISVRNWEKYQSVDRMAELREYNRQAQKRSRDKKKEMSNNVNDSQIDESMTSQHRIDKKRKDKNRLDYSSADEASLRNEFRKKAQTLTQQWQHNVDAEEANKEIRHE